MHTWILSLGLALASVSTPPLDFTPTLPDGTMPLYVPDPVLPRHDGEPVGFACYGSCGASCKCVNKKLSTTKTEENGQVCTWNLTSCATHSFCRWHDSCYLACDNQEPGHVGDLSFKRSFCYRKCDESCVTGNDPKPLGGWNSDELDPGPPPEALGPVACIKRMANSLDVPYDGTFVYADLVGCEPASH